MQQSQKFPWYVDDVILLLMFSNGTKNSLKKHARGFDKSMTVNKQKFMNLR